MANAALARSPQPFTIFRTVTLGLHKSPDEYREEALKSAGRRISYWGDDILGRITCSQQRTDVDLVNVSVSELGFSKGARYADICAKGLELGLELCPAEVGPALRLQYGDQPKGEWLRIAMEAITDRDGNRSFFAVGRDDDELWLDGTYGYPDRFYDVDRCFVFVRRKS